MVNQNGEAPWLRVGGALWLDAVNTVIRENGAPVELWPDFASLLAWTRAFEALGEAVTRDWENWDNERQSNALSEAREVRATLRQLCDQLETGAPSPALVERLNAWIGAVAMRRELRWNDESAHWHEAPLSNDASALWFVIASSAGEYMAAPNRPPLRRCGADGCVLWFLDLTKNRSRRWCSMETCGNRHKVARHYQRRKN